MTLMLGEEVHDALDLRDDDMEAALALWQEMLEEGIRIPVDGAPSNETLELLAACNKRSENFAKEFYGY